MSEQILQLYDVKVNQHLIKIHQRLNQKFPFIQDSRQLKNQDNQLLWQLGNQSIQYKNLVAVMAIDTYTQNITQIFNETDFILQSLSISLSCALKLKQQITKQKSSSNIHSSYDNLFNALINIIESVSLFNPSSPYLNLYRQILTNRSCQLTEDIYQTLKNQNAELKQRLIFNDQKIIELQIKLTKILQEQEQYQNQGRVQTSLKFMELRQKLEKKQLEISKMNQQFSFEIEKYNVVYETLKKQLNQYKTYSNVDTLKLIQSLQTQIILLREQIQRQKLTNQQLRNRIQLLVQKDNFNFRQSRSPRSRISKYSNYQQQPYYSAERVNDSNMFYHSRNSQINNLDTEHDPELIYADQKDNFSRYSYVRKQGGRIRQKSILNKFDELNEY